MDPAAESPLTNSKQTLRRTQGNSSFLGDGSIHSTTSSVSSSHHSSFHNDNDVRNDDDDGKGIVKSNGKKRSRTTTRKSKKKSTSYIVSWMLSLALAFSLFQTFTYSPPSHLDSAAEVHHPHNLMLQSAASSSQLHHIIKQQQQQQKQEKHQDDPAAPHKDISPPSKDTPKNVALPAAKPKMDTPKTTLSSSPLQLLSNNTRTIMQVLEEAGVAKSLSTEELDGIPQLEQIWNNLYGPSASSALSQHGGNVSSLGSGPVIYGLESCQAYRDLVPLHERYSAPAGMFNTGTNNLELNLKHNIKDVISLYQVPWGKHRMEARRLHHVAPGAERFDHKKCLPIVIVRDPYHWMQSMCKSPYAAHWKHGPHRCPNLVASKKDKDKWSKVIFDEDEMHRKDSEKDDEENDVTPFQVKIIFDKDDVEYFDSLADLWNEWYRPYWENKDGYPRIIIRFEDMLLHAPILMDKIAQCLGVERNPKNYVYQTNSAKAHGSGTNFLKAIMKTADAEKRANGLTLKDKIYAAQHLDGEMMQAFQYQTVQQ